MEKRRLVRVQLSLLDPPGGHPAGAQLVTAFCPLLGCWLDCRLENAE